MMIAPRPCSNIENQAKSGNFGVILNTLPDYEDDKKCNSIDEYDFSVCDSIQLPSNNLDNGQKKMAYQEGVWISKVEVHEHDFDDGNVDFSHKKYQKETNMNNFGKNRKEEIYKRGIERRLSENYNRSEFAQNRDEYYVRDEIDNSYQYRNCGDKDNIENYHIKKFEKYGPNPKNALVAKSTESSTSNNLLVNSKAEDDNTDNVDSGSEERSYSFSETV